MKCIIILFMVASYSLQASVVIAETEINGTYVSAGELKLVSNYVCFYTYRLFLHSFTPPPSHILLLNQLFHFYLIIFSNASSI